MSKRVLCLLAEGFEEIEAVTVIDILRRAGCEVVVAGVAGAEPVRASRGVVLVPDVALEPVSGEAFDLVFLPGGMGGTERLRDDPRVQQVLAAQAEADRPIAAICAAPLALEPGGLTRGRQITSHPGVRDRLAGGHRTYLEDRVVVDGKLITSRGPGTAMELALALVGLLCGPQKAREVHAPLIAPEGVGA